MDIILIGGLWLTGAAWDDVVPGLEARGHRAVPLTLLGQGDGAASATLQNQADAVVAAVDAAAGRPLVVGHSAACALAWLAADRRPERVAATALIGGFPAADGEEYFSSLQPEGGVLAFPGWEPFEGPDVADLDGAARARIAATLVDVPEAVVKGTVRLTDERRYDVPTWLVCPEFTPAEAREWVAGGELPELAGAARLEYADLDSGHWPMYSRPADLADLLATIAEGL
ncbi:alpha/beta fold hydrolase [Nocardioides sp. cx-173]|uniref:alpha/beta fold hydrolase n=1 Tax=Nocardioides sp. cx-173 TaxID=2898796 RepID=UPI001E376000|nr:alpha/beta fold hydrolase [Nocardioides sp. cx-173]MCD4526573.1 alpha/beta fold hydrolase [Nocardioides sp. cx-173]UGB40668.1 alpha/beta fold hydrolase [Nocardioides sp. cx-173]